MCAYIPVVAHQQSAKFTFIAIITDLTMFLSDIAIFNRISASAKTEAKFKDENDPEVDRLYNSSPIITESSTTYEVDDHYKTDLEVL